MQAQARQAQTVMQVMPKFCKANDVNRGDHPMCMPPGASKGLEGDELVAAYLPEASGPEDGRLEPGPYLLRALMVFKRMILWDVLLNSRDIPGVISSPESALSSTDSMDSMDDAGAAAAAE